MKFGGFIAIVFGLLMLVCYWWFNPELWLLIFGLVLLIGGLILICIGIDVHRGRKKR